jgi:hypothetical protein
MVCPLCGYQYRCPCSHCNDRDQHLEKWISLDGDCEACPCCGLVLHLDFWQDVEWDQHKEMLRLSTQSGGCLSVAK